MSFHLIGLATISSTRQRAIDDQDKAARKNSILEAARQLFLEDPSQLPSVITISRAAGLAKGTVYLYFKTKEEIFLTILEQYYKDLLQRLEAVATSDGHQGKPLIMKLADTVADFVKLHPDYLPLNAMTTSVLEQNVEVSRIIQFKQALFDALSTLGPQLQIKLPHLSADQCRQLLMQTNALTLGLWQMQALPSDIRSALPEIQLRTLVPEFESTLKQAMIWLWHGAGEH